MTAEEAQRFLEALRTEAKGTRDMALAAAAQAFRLRPQFLRQQPRVRQAEWVRRALARPGNSSVAEEILAEYFLENHRPLLVELLDALGVPHEDGTLKEESPAAPAKAKLGKAVEAFRKGDEPERRELLLRAFAAQSAIDWPELEGLLQDG
jgi:hypothetical protein